MVVLFGSLSVPMAAAVSPFPRVRAGASVICCRFPTAHARCSKPSRRSSTTTVRRDLNPLSPSPDSLSAAAVGKSAGHHYIREDYIVEKVDNEEENNVDENAFDALFAQLEEDLQNDELSLDIDDRINDEELAMFEKELADALGDEDYDEFPNSLLSSPNSIDTNYKESKQRHPKLKNWQLRQLAAALKMGRRKTKIKRLAMELGLDRAFVLDLLRDPPSSLLMLSTTLPTTIEQHTETTEDEVVESPSTSVPGPTKTDSQPKAASHLMQSRLSIRKRLKKVQVEVLERVYYQTKRPTNAMINSIIEVTNLPWKRIVEWFEDKRIRDGIPEKRVPFRR